MPLKEGASKGAFESNLKTEVHSGKPLNQALAIAFSKKRESMRRRKMWRGGVACMNEGGVFGEEFIDNGGAPASAHTEAGEKEREDLQREDRMNDPLAFYQGGMIDGDYRDFHAEVSRPSTTDDIRPKPHMVDMESFGPTEKEVYDDRDEMSIAKALKKRRSYGGYY